MANLGDNFKLDNIPHSFKVLKSGELTPKSGKNRMPRNSVFTINSNSMKKSMKSKRNIQRSRSKYTSKLHIYLSSKPKDILNLRLKQKLPIRDQMLIIVKDIVEELFETAYEKAETREYLRKAPATINNILGCFLDLGISAAMLNVEREEPAIHQFGENSGLEPVPCEADNWIRNFIKVKKVDKRKRLDSDSTISRQIKILGEKKTAMSNTTKEKYGRSFKSHMKHKRRNLLPEPVEIDNYVEEDYITKERKKIF